MHYLTCLSLLLTSQSLTHSVSCLPMYRVENAVTPIVSSAAVFPKSMTLFGLANMVHGTIAVMLSICRLFSVVLW